MKDMEKLLLNKHSLDDLIKMQIEEEFYTKQETTTKKNKIITDITQLKPNQIFNKSSVFKFFNRKNKTETFIDGVQAEAIIGSETEIKEKFMDGSLSAFATDDAFIKFERASICDV